MRPPSVLAVRNVVIATAALTLFHFTDNTLSIDTYPAPSWQPDWFEWVVALSWPLFTAFGVIGYRAYKRGDFHRAHIALVAYSYTGLVSLGHFLYGAPGDLTTRAFVSVLIDAAAGLAVLAVVTRSVLSRRSPASTA